MATRCWIVSLPASSLWSRLQESIPKKIHLTLLSTGLRVIWQFNIPNLRVGTLDSLLSLSDDLIKSNTFIEACSHKIRRQIEDLLKVSGILSCSLSVDDVPLDSYLIKFVWDAAKYPTMSPLIVDGIHVQVAKIEDDLKILQEATSLHEDNEYAIYTVTLFNRDADNFRNKACERGFQNTIQILESRKQEIEKLMQDQESLRSSLLNWCYTSYGEVFTSWMHFCAVSLLAESSLRCGLPPSFLSVVLSPSLKSEMNIRSILETLCDTPNSTFWKTEDEGNMGSLGADPDTHPYVSFTINLI